MRIFVLIDTQFGVKSVTSVHMQWIFKVTCENKDIEIGLSAHFHTISFFKWQK